MTTVWRFLATFASLIVCTLHCFDRVIFKGHLALSSANELERFVDYVLKVRRSLFMNVIAPQYSDLLVEHAKRMAATAGRTYLYRTGSFRVLRLLEKFSLTQLAAAVEYAQNIDVIDADSIRMIVEHRSDQPVEVFPLDGRPHLAHVRVEATDVFSYQALLGR